MEKINNADSRATDIGTSESALDFEQHLEKLKQERLLGLKRFLNCDKKIKSDIFGAIDYIDVNEPTKTQDCLYAAASDCGQYFEIMLEYCGYDQTWVTNQINIIKNAIVLTGASKEKMHGVYRDFFTNLSREFCEAVEVSAFGFSTSTCYEGRWEDVVGGGY
ncbi:MAG: hypothetical protein Q4A79_01430 [Candidatus Saccharibacteria bacterium]|nr:hypothetical protein [Candidatus Saccharibacteria bacterium]